MECRPSYSICANDDTDLLFASDIILNMLFHLATLASFCTDTNFYFRTGSDTFLCLHNGARERQAPLRKTCSCAHNCHYRHTSSPSPDRSTEVGANLMKVAHLKQILELKHLQPPEPACTECATGAAAETIQDDNLLMCGRVSLHCIPHMFSKVQLQQCWQTNLL